MRRGRLRIRLKPRGVGLGCIVDQYDGRTSSGIPCQFLIGDQNARAGVFDDVGDLVRRQPVVDRQEDRADVADGERNIEKRRAVLHQHRNDVVGADPSRGQPSADPPYTFVEGRIGDFFAAVFQRATRRRLPGVKCDEAR